MRVIIRLDDICPGMDYNKFRRVKEIFLKHKVPAVMGIIPDNKDKGLNGKIQKKKYFNELRGLIAKRWEIAQHGYQHILSQGKGIFDVHNGEFPGLQFRVQFEKIKKGKTKLKKEGLETDFFYAPAHAYDINTFVALKKNGFKVILDGRGIYPYKKHGLLFIPQIIYRPINLIFPGIIVICLHPNLMKERDFIKLDNFLSKNSKKIKTVKEVVKKYNDLSPSKRIYYGLMNLIIKTIWPIIWKIKKIEEYA